MTTLDRYAVFLNSVVFSAAELENPSPYLLSLFTQAEIDARRGEPILNDEYMERSRLKYREYLQQCNDMVVRPSLFGRKDLGEITLAEFVDLYTSQHGAITVDAWFDMGLLMCYSDDYTNMGFSDDALCKLTHMKANHNLKYRISIDIGYRHFCRGVDDYDQKYSLEIYIDDVQMTDVNECKYGWKLIALNYQEKGMIYAINNAHKKYLHALHYAEFKANMGRITEELIAEAMHPKRLMRHLELGGEIEDF